MIEACGSQVRATDGGAYAWDFPAVLQMGDLLGADLEMLAGLLPAIEPQVLRAWKREGGE